MEENTYLVFKFKQGQIIQIGDDLFVKVIRAKGNKILQMWVCAPPSLRVHRLKEFQTRDPWKERYERFENEKRNSINPDLNGSDVMQINSSSKPEPVT